MAYWLSRFRGTKRGRVNSSKRRTTSMLNTGCKLITALLPIILLQSAASKRAEELQREVHYPPHVGYFGASSSRLCLWTLGLQISDGI